MAKRILILGASRYYLRAILAAREMGAEVIVTDRDALAPGLRAAHHGEAIDIVDVEGTLQVARKYDIDGIVAVNDFGVQTAAAIAEKLGLPGVGQNAARNATSKALMRQVWARSGVPSARFGLAHDADEAARVADEISTWPLIVKPADSRGGGSRGVSRVDEPSQLAGAVAFAQAFYSDKTVVIEEFLDGVEHSVETLTVDGRTHVIAISDKEKTPAPYRVDRSVIYPTIFQGTERHEIERAAIDAVQALGIRTGAAHVELCTTETGPRLFEVGARCGGGGTPDPIIPWVTGIEMFKEVVRIALGDTPTRTVPLHERGCVYRFLMPTPGILNGVRGLEEARAAEGVLDVDVLIPRGQKIYPVRTGADRAGFIIVGAEHRAAAIRRADEVEARIAFEVTA